MFLLCIWVLYLAYLFDAYLYEEGRFDETTGQSILSTQISSYTHKCVHNSDSMSPTDRRLGIFIIRSYH